MVIICQVFQGSGLCGGEKSLSARWVLHDPKAQFMSIFLKVIRCTVGEREGGLGRCHNLRSKAGQEPHTSDTGARMCGLKILCT